MLIKVYSRRACMRLSGGAAEKGRKGEVRRGNRIIVSLRTEQLTGHIRGEGGDPMGRGGLEGAGRGGRTVEKKN